MAGGSSGTGLSHDLGGVSETLLIMLYIRAMESLRPDALIRDEKAVELVTRLGYDFDRIRQIPLSEGNKVVAVLRDRECDRCTRDFLARHPDTVVVHIGCGLDSRFERVDDGRVEWYDLDLPDVIELRRALIGDERDRYHLLSCSVFDGAWRQAVSAHRQRRFLFVAEGVFHLFDKGQVRSLVLTLRDQFPGAELVFDAFSPLLIRVGNLQVSHSKISARARWGLWHGQEIEGWGDGIRLIDEWRWADRPEPRLARLRWMRHIGFLARTTCVYHFRLGDAELRA
jgi:O-methyltransferase involved in polyketide biosynthesis